MDPTLVPKNKVIAATGGAAAGSALSVILVWGLKGLFSKLGIEAPQEVLDAFSTLFTALTAGLAGYYVPPGANEGSFVDPTTRTVKSALKPNA